MHTSREDTYWWVMYTEIRRPSGSLRRHRQAADILDNHLLAPNAIVLRKSKRISLFLLQTTRAV